MGGDASLFVESNFQNHILKNSLGDSQQDIFFTPLNFVIEIKQILYQSQASIVMTNTKVKITIRRTKKF